MTYISWDIEQNILTLVILGHFLPFYHLKNPKNQNFEKWKNLLEISSFSRFVPKITILWCMVPEIQSERDRIFCHFGSFFIISAPWQPEKWKFWNWKKTPGDIIILHIYTIKDNHLMYGSWDIKRDRQNLSFWTIFCLFIPLLT